MKTNGKSVDTEDQFKEMFEGMGVSEKGNCDMQVNVIVNLIER